MDFDAIDTLKITFLLQFCSVFFRFWHIQNHVYFHLIFHGFWHAFGYILAHIFKTCSRIVFVYLFDDALRRLLDASGTPLG
jgi:hypothetical protein